MSSNEYPTSTNTGSTDDLPQTPKTTKSPDLPREVGSTPATHHSTTSHAFRNGTADEMRGALVNEILAVPEVNIQIFIRQLLPELKDGINVEDIVSRLKDEGTIIRDIDQKKDVWKYFRSSLQAKGHHEDVVFAPLEELSAKINQYGSQDLNDLEPTVVLTLQPKEIPKSHRGSNTRPDAQFILKSAEDEALAQEKALVKNARKAIKTRVPRWWYDLALTGELKKEDLDDVTDDNVSKIIFNMQQVMAIDASRRFTFGFTIEHKKMCLWFSCRSIIVVSTAFDFTTEFKLLTHIFLALSFASKQELGWDPTIQPIGDRSLDGPRQYNITVDGQIYQTIQLLSEHAADALISRATRVWRVVNIGNRKEYILKDIWVEDDRELEHAIRQRILDDVEEKYTRIEREVVVKHFLTPFQHWLVIVGGVEDHTTSVMMRGYRPSFDVGFRLKIKETNVDDRKKALGPAGATDTAITAIRIPRKMRTLTSPSPLCGGRRRLHHRLHYRIVFEEIADPLDTLKDLSSVFSVLRDTAKVLEWIHGSGWLHRDISMGNLYYFNGRGLLGDLEYAKHEDDKVVHEVRSGFPDCMATEIIRGQFNFLQSNTVDVNALIALYSNLQKNAGKASPTTTSDTAPPFSHNALHDLESLWWVAIWELFFSDDATEEQTEEQYMQRELVMRDLFPRTNDNTERRFFFETEETYKKDFDWVPERLRLITEALNQLRRLLISKFKSFEGHFPTVDKEIFGGTQDGFRTLLEACRVYAIGISLSPYKTTGLPKSTPDATSPGEINQELITQDVAKLDLEDGVPAPLPEGFAMGYELKVENNDDGDDSSELPT